MTNRTAATLTQRSRLAPLTTASAATAQSAATAPAPTDSGELYLAARFAVRIWVRSPHSARKTTTNAVRTVR